MDDEIITGVTDEPTEPKNYVPVDENGKPFKGIEPTTEKAGKVIEVFFRRAPQYLKDDPPLEWLNSIKE